MESCDLWALRPSRSSQPIVTLLANPEPAIQEVPPERGRLGLASSLPSGSALLLFSVSLLLGGTVPRGAFPLPVLTDAAFNSLWWLISRNHRTITTPLLELLERRCWLIPSFPLISSPPGPLPHSLSFSPLFFTLSFPLLQPTRTR